jgi:phosphoribosyl 1,2-cyclic phosphate phosphodiesterase
MGALRHEPHPAHFTLSQAVETVRRIQPQQTYFTHICHDLDHDQVNAQLPKEMQLGHDSLSFEL